MKYIITTALTSGFDLKAMEDEMREEAPKKAREIDVRELQGSVEAVIYNCLGWYLKQDLSNTTQLSEDCQPTNKLVFQLAPI